MSRARVIAAACLICALGALGYWFTRSSTPAVVPLPAVRSARVRLAELRHQEPASVAGTTRAAATVCARGDGPQTCTTASDAGAWQLAALPPGTYSVWASAAGMRGSPIELVLAAGEHREGVELLLLAGAVEVRGTVRDVRGGPIAGAVVAVVAGKPIYTTRTDARGAFSAWALPGPIDVTAAADGYVDDVVSTVAPDAAVAVALVPGGSIAGTVIDAATRAPIADAKVDAPGGEATRSDAAGRFLMSKLPPDRYKPTATSIGGYGEAAESVRVSPGQAVEGVVIEVHPVAVVAGHVLIDGGRGCPADQGEVVISRHGGSTSYTARTLDDGQVLLEGVVPGTYEVTASCKHWLSEAPYPDLVVGDSDVEDVTWRVSMGARISGSVHGPRGEPIAEAIVIFRPSNGVSYTSVASGSDGTFAVDGLGTAVYALEARADGYLRSRQQVNVAVAVGSAATCVVAMERGGAIAGVVVDETGAPVPEARVEVTPVDDDEVHQSESAHADRDGAFRIEALAPGAYRVATEDDFRDRSARDVPVEVVLDATAQVRVVAPSPSEAIDGVVVDAAGAPVGDAYVEASKEDGSAIGYLPRYTGTSDKVLTSPDGSFHIGHLPHAQFAVRAFRPGGGEAVVRRVTPGERVTVTIRPTGVLAGVVVSAHGAPVTDVVITATDREHGVSREERAYFTDGRFAIRELPAGTYKLVVDGDPETELDATIGETEQRTDLRLTVQPRYAIHGRLVRNGAPLAGWRVDIDRLDTVDGAHSGRTITTATVLTALSATDGTFVVHDLPAVTTSVSVYDVTRGADPPVAATRTVTPSGAAPTYEIGDIVIE